MKINKRIIGFDLARAYAIFGMYIVNFNIVFGNSNDTSWSAQFLSLFSGNSSTVFIMLAGMGIALMTNRSSYTQEEKYKLKRTLLKRALFLFGLGLLLSLWWPADILHFYGVYMCIAALLIFLDKKYYLYTTVCIIFLFHILLIILPYETGWNFQKLEYEGFWTVNGFLRNTFYNGWNAVFPWLAYYTVGMYLGRLDWTLAHTQFKMLTIGFLFYISVLLLQFVSNHLSIHEDLRVFINADYLPPLFPFMISTLGFGLMLIAFFMYGSKFISENSFAQNLAKTGQMTLTHYISHLTIGILFFELIIGKNTTVKSNSITFIHPMIILAFAIVYFIASYHFSKFWAKKFKIGPFELLMRKSVT